MKLEYNVIIENKFHENRVEATIEIISYYLNKANGIYPVEWLDTKRGDNNKTNLFYCYLDNILYPLYIEETSTKMAMQKLIAEMQEIAKYNPYGWELPEWER